MNREIMQQALWALKDLIAVYPETACIETRISAQKVIATLEAAIDKSALEDELAKPEQSKYSDIVSDGGFDPRNKFDAHPKQELDYPPECTTPELEVAYAAGWWKALEVQRQQALDKKATNARELGLDYEPEQKFVDIHCPSCLHSFSVVPVAKREWVSLTNDDIQNVWDGMKGAVCLDHKTFARAIEAKLREKNGRTDSHTGGGATGSGRAWASGGVDES